jgi:hypothetical protein
MTETLVTADEIRARLGLPKLPVVEVLTRQAAEYGMELEFSEDWAGRPCLPADQAAELVRVVEHATAAAARQQRQAEHAHQAEAAMLDAYLHERAKAVVEHVVRQTGDIYAGEALAYLSAHATATDDDVAYTVAAVLGRWEAGFRSFRSELRPGHQPLTGAMDYGDLEAKQELRETPPTDEGLKRQLSPRARRRFRELIRGTIQ